MAMLTAMSLGFAPAERLTTPSGGKKPHVMMVLFDDFGWADAGWHRNATAPGGEFVPVRIELVHIPSNDFEQIWRFERLDATADFDALVTHPAFAKPQTWFQLGDPFERFFATGADAHSLDCGPRGCV